MYRYTLIDWFDDVAGNPIELDLDEALELGDEFTVNDVTFSIEHIEYQINKKGFNALVRMRRYRIPDTQTQFVHKCPAKKGMMSKLSRDDVIKLEKSVGKKQVTSWKNGRMKFSSYNKKEIVCPDCGTIFWKHNNCIPGTVDIDPIMNKKTLRKRK